MPTTIVPNGEVQLSYTVASLVHVHRIRCQLNNPAGPSPYLLDLQGGGTINWMTAVIQVDVLIQAFFSAATIFGQWVLYERVGTNYIPLSSVASTAVGANAGADQAAGQMTLSFRNANNKLDKFVYMEDSFLAPAKYQSGTFGGANSMIASILDTSAGHIGSWALGRDGTVPTRILANVISLNRKIRRRRGLA
jgi:hypothetical protein